MTLRVASPGDLAAIVELMGLHNRREHTLDAPPPVDDAIVQAADDGALDAAAWWDERLGGRVVMRVFYRNAEAARELVAAMMERAPSGRSLRIERVLRAETAALPAETIALYEGLGFEFFYVEHEMARELAALPERPPIAGLTIERWAAAHDGPLRDTYNDAFSTRGFRGYGEDEWRAERFSAQDDFMPEASFVAIAGDQIVGFTMCLRAEDEGWIDSAGVRPAWRGQGIADALLVRSMEAMRVAGMKRVVLRVNENNARAIAVYRRMGFEVQRKHVVWVKPAAP